MCAFPNFVTDVEEMSCLTSEGKKKADHASKDNICHKLQTSGTG